MTSQSELTVIVPQEKCESWDEFSDVYSTFAEPFHTYADHILASQTRVDLAKSILEVACATGYGAITVRPLLPEGATYCCTDISSEMLKKMKDRLASTDFLCNPHNKLDFDLEDHKDKIVVSTHSSKKGITLKVNRADNENLPYVDCSFDSYMAPYSLYHVANPSKMLQESYRVLKNDGIASFAIFGKEKDSPFFTAFPGILMKYAEKYGIPMPVRRSFFYLGENEPGLVEMAKTAGYKKVRCWHVPLVYPLKVKEFADFMFNGKLTFRDFIAKFPEEAKKAMREELEVLAQKKFIEGEERMEYDTLILTCYK